MKESIKRAMNGASEEQLLNLLDTIKQLVDVRRQINSKFDEIVETIEKSPYKDDEALMQKFHRISKLMKFNDGAQIEEIINSLKDELQKREADV